MQATFHWLTLGLVLGIVGKLPIITPSRSSFSLPQRTSHTTLLHLQREPSTAQAGIENMAQVCCLWVKTIITWHLHTAPQTLPRCPSLPIKGLQLAHTSAWALDTAGRLPTRHALFYGLLISLPVIRPLIYVQLLFLTFISIMLLFSPITLFLSNLPNGFLSHVLIKFYCLLKLVQTTAVLSDYEHVLGIIGSRWALLACVSGSWWVRNVFLDTNRLVSPRRRGSRCSGI